MSRRLDHIQIWHEGYGRAWIAVLVLPEKNYMVVTESDLDPRSENCP